MIYLEKKNNRKTQQKTADFVDFWVNYYIKSAQI